MRMPAEWAPQSAILFAWPCSAKIWPDSRPQILNDFAKLITEVSRFTTVKLLCQKNFQKEATNFIGEEADVTFLDIETDDVWCRDFGPITICDDRKKSIISWGFNAWGGKFADFAKDNAAPAKIAQHENLDCIEVPFILEGGAMEVNGTGLGITTENVIYNSNRNSTEQKEALTEAIKKHFGLNELIVLEDGLINDDTDGHIDNITRFVSEDTVITCTCPEENPNYDILQQNLKQLKSWNSKDGSKLKIVELPLPDPIYLDGEILPASYANFLISNDAVFIPSFNQNYSDLLAEKILQDCFPNKKIIAIDCRYFLLEGGAIHCLSQQLLT